MFAPRRVGIILRWHGAALGFKRQLSVSDHFFLAKLGGFRPNLGEIGRPRPDFGRIRPAWYHMGAISLNSGKQLAELGLARPKSNIFRFKLARARPNLVEPGTHTHTHTHLAELGPNLLERGPN